VSEWTDKDIADGNPVVRARAEAELHLQFEVAVSALGHQPSAPVTVEDQYAVLDAVGRRAVALPVGFVEGDGLPRVSRLGCLERRGVFGRFYPLRKVPTAPRG
jgi:hypothetical protein